MTNEIETMFSRAVLAYLAFSYLSILPSPFFLVIPFTLPSSPFLASLDVLNTKAGLCMSSMENAILNAGMCTFRVFDTQVSF